MARKRRQKVSGGPINAQLNFILMLALAFFLIVGVMAAVNGVAVRTRADIVCGPTPTLPTTQCDAGWRFERDHNGCPVFQCPATAVPLE